jgi:predicted RNA-binding protein with PIN domain
MPLHYYIDGYNVLHQSSLLRPLLRNDFETARDALVEKVARFCMATESRASIIFDGRGRRAESVPVIPNIEGLEVTYSPGHLTADAVIERLIYNAEARRHLVVVSGDRSLRDLCRGLGALVMSPDNFLVAVRESAGHTRDALKNVHQTHRPLRVEDRLNEDSLHLLKNLKRKLGEN